MPGAAGGLQALWSPCSTLWWLRGGSHLQVPVHYILLVAIMHSRDNLREEGLGSAPGEPAWLPPPRHECPLGRQAGSDSPGPEAEARAPAAWTCPQPSSGSPLKGQEPAGILSPSGKAAASVPTLASGQAEAGRADGLGPAWRHCPLQTCLNLARASFSFMRPWETR